ncbi:hypothetical protein MiSe_93710 [Microseira wollei NIES-4236]|uniref:Uncharacterized protein n=2 Tax=Microseira wollei TaxID=467598 RepID=A0AAV3XRN7_9CYAN|nr:hypothetical protein MiSe_93710 [Microseira wollei NIES-4236]
MLAFFMDLRSSNSLLEGRMILTKRGELVDVYIATSGSVGNKTLQTVIIFLGQFLTARWAVWGMARLPPPTTTCHSK